jgi:hypothetical protein
VSDSSVLTGNAIPTHELGTGLTNRSPRGGIRGIVELEVLKQIEMYLGGHLPIQSFFDLIVGTRFVHFVPELKSIPYESNLSVKALGEL